MPGIRISARKGPTPELQGIGQRIMAERKAQRLQRRACAEMAGLSEEHLRKIEQGILQDISASTIIRVCRTLGMNPAYLLGLKE